MLLLSLILLVVLIYFIFFISQFYNVIFKGYAPFVSTDKETIRRIIDEAQIKEPATIYELGCGRALFLRVVEKIYPRTKLIGLENLFSLYLAVKIRLKLSGSRIELLKKDFFKVNLKDAALIYCYLNNATIARLGGKFKRECQGGTQIISRSFSIPGLEPEKVIRIKNKPVYFYRI